VLHHLAIALYLRRRHRCGRAIDHRVGGFTPVRRRAPNSLTRRSDLLEAILIRA
jgi:hypothetical protein